MALADYVDYMQVCVCVCGGGGGTVGGRVSGEKTPKGLTAPVYAEASG